MRYRPLGSSGIDISVVGLGLWQAAGSAAWGADYSDVDSIRTIHAAPDLGINLVDTAPAYSRGESERLLGRALRGRRERYVVATKINTNQITREQVRASVEASLQRLQTDRIDLLQIHWPNTLGEPFAETIAAMEELRREGKIRALGVSNFSAPQLAECLEIAPVHSLQPPYNLLWRHVEDDALPFCAARGIAVITYSPLAQGLLSGKYHRHNRPLDGTRPRNLLWHGACFDVAMTVVEELRRIADRHGATCAQVALAWLLAQRGVSAVLAGAKRPEQLGENAGAAELALSEEELRALADASEPLRAITAGEPKMWFTGTAGDYDVR